MARKDFSVDDENMLAFTKRLRVIWAQEIQTRLTVRGVNVFLVLQLILDRDPSELLCERKLFR